MTKSTELTDQEVYDVRMSAYLEASIAVLQASIGHLAAIIAAAAIAQLAEQEAEKRTQARMIDNDR